MERPMALTLAAALAAALSGLTGNAVAQSPVPAAQPNYKFEKCHGIVKNGKNDCATASSSCAGTATISRTRGSMCRPAPATRSSAAARSPSSRRFDSDLSPLGRGRIPSAARNPGEGEQKEANE
ncbi:MAG: BufA1 family periplasmic bufferin-type metallophore [Rhodoplanes sp.]